MTADNTIWKVDPSVRFDDFDVSAEQLAEDLAPFIEQLAAEGIIERVESA
jgi:hypothetical protein